MKKNLNYCFGLDIQAEKQPYKKAIITEQASISYLELQESSFRLAGALQNKGMKNGDTILIFMPNCIEYAIVFFAAVRLNLNITLANALYKCSELGPLIRTAHPKLAFVMDDKEATLLHSADQGLDVICVPAFLKQFYKEDTSGVPSFSCQPGPDHACICISTSGSTGKPKIVSNSYENEMVNASLYVERLLVTEDDVILTALPATQRFGLAAMLGSCLKGASLVLVHGFHAAAMLSLIERYHVSVQYGVPTIYLKEIKAFEAAETAPDISSLRTGVVAGANCSKEIFRWFDEHIGCRLLNCYGTSEIGGLAMVKYDATEDVRYHTCGDVLRDAVIEITDQEGRILPAGETGGIICRVPWVMNGYAGEPELTARMFDEEGFFLTGDIGRLDEEGHLILSGRKKDMIIRGGYNIFPAELEQALLNLPSVLEACVMGYPDALLGERIFAFVKPAADSVQEEKMRQELARHIARYKLPDHILYVEKIPKLPGGKFDYSTLRSYLEKEYSGNSEDCHI